MTCAAAVVAVAGLLSTGCGPAVLSDAVTLLRLPEGGRLPSALVDDDGVVHVVYFQGEPRSGDLLYVKRAPGEADWSEPQYVNSQAETAVGIGPIDGGQVALGADGRLHVVWFKLGRTDFLYTRTDDAGTGFERQFTLAGGEGVEAGPTVAADREGGVYVFWHTGEPPEAERTVWMAVSHDNGRTFEPARPISAAAEGACDCCGLRALTEEPGVVHVSYRGAGENVRRGQRLLTSRDSGRTFEDIGIDDWRINACPISTTSLAAGPDGAAVAWENAGQVFLSPVDRLDKLEEALSPDGSAEWRRKNPAVAVNEWRDAPGMGGRPRLAVGRNVPLAALRRRRPADRRSRDGARDSGRERGGRRRRAGRRLPGALLTPPKPIAGSVFGPGRHRSGEFAPRHPLRGCSAAQAPRGQLPQP